MPSFGLVREGYTDEVVIRHILAGYFNVRNPDLRKIPSEDSHNTPRGWLSVINYVGSSDFREAFQAVDYMIVHIDADKCEDERYGVGRSDNGRELEPLELLAKVREKFREWIGETLYEKRKKRIIFAIAVDSTECWLLPLYDAERQSEWRDCKTVLDAALNILPEYAEKTSKGMRYERASKVLSDQRTLLQAAPHNPSLNAFIEELRGRVGEPE